MTVAAVSASAGNLTTLFVAYILGIPITYPLIKIRENPEAIRSAKIFLLETIFPALILFLPAIFILYYWTGHASFIGSPTLGQAHVDPVGVD